MKRTYSELKALAKNLVQKSINNDPGTGIIVIAWNRGTDRTPVAQFVNATPQENAVIIHLLRSMADSVETSKIANEQGMYVTPSGLVVPRA